LKIYKNPIPTVDAIIHRHSSILLVKRKKDPYKNCFALPGGFVNEGETIEDAIMREVYEETSLEVYPIDILGVYSDPTRDPRGHMLTVVFIVLVVKGGNPIAGDDAQEISWIPISKINEIEIAFDHKLLIQDFLTWKKEGGTYWTNKRR
jgi:ADP-ribose pyrophosphatase YjhB (NUDIX family)